MPHFLRVNVLRKVPPRNTVTGSKRAIVGQKFGNHQNFTIFAIIRWDYYSTSITTPTAKSDGV